MSESEVKRLEVYIADLSARLSAAEKRFDDHHHFLKSVIQTFTEKEGHLKSKLESLTNAVAQMFHEPNENTKSN
jgi:chaperonin cofactor prefoldin